MRGRRAAAAALGLALDRVVTHPRQIPHPVAGFGRLMGLIERRVHADDVAAGATYAAVGVAVAAAAGALVRSTTLATWMAVGGRQLHDTASAIGDLLTVGDLDGARAALPSLVGRDPQALDEAGIARSVVESVAENTVDAIVAPAFWAGVGGAPGVLVHRAVDTMDSMVGYRSPRYARFGTASARLDDAMAWIPARLTAGLVALARPERAREVLHAVRRDAPGHPSPNAGVAEAAFAGALDLRLGGPTDYGDHVEERPGLGRGRPPEASDIGRAVDLSREVAAATTAALLALGAAR